MSQTIDEQLSALLDGELPVEQQEMLLRRLERDPQLRDRFARYSLIGAVLIDGDLPVDAMRIADGVRDHLSQEGQPIVRRRPGFAAGSGLLGAGLAAAAAVLVLLNLDPGSGGAGKQPLAAVTPVASTTTESPVRLRATVAPERMTRYLVTHSRYSNSASRQFVDSHVVMPAFRRVALQNGGSAR